MQLLKFKRKAKTPQERIPADLLAAIEGATVHRRSDTGESDDLRPRIIVQFPGSTAQVYTSEALTNWMQKRFAGLTDDQLAAALRMVEGVVRSHLRETQQRMDVLHKRPRKNWIHSY